MLGASTTRGVLGGAQQAGSECAAIGGVAQRFLARQTRLDEFSSNDLIEAVSELRDGRTRPMVWWEESKSLVTKSDSVQRTRW